MVGSKRALGKILWAKPIKKFLLFIERYVRWLPIYETYGLLQVEYLRMKYWNKLSGQELSSDYKVKTVKPLIRGIYRLTRPFLQIEFSSLLAQGQSVRAFKQP